MISRALTSQLLELLQEFPAVALIGARQVGKTTLAKSIATASVYLDLESESDRAKLLSPEHYLAAHAHDLVILDEVQRQPQLFQSLRGLIDKHPHNTGRFLVLGSASLDLLRQSGESLAGRIAYLELCPFTAIEVDDYECLWLRGGFPRSFLATTDKSSARWREQFIRTYLERDIPQLGPRVPAETLRRFWTMLAHEQGSILNTARLAGNLGVSGKTIARYVDLLSDLLLIHRLPAWRSNTGKRLVKSPKIYLRDSGILHTLLGISGRDNLLGHSVVGVSWEGFVIANILATASSNSRAYFYRSVSGAEVDLLLTVGGEELWAIEIKFSLAPRPAKGFHYACEDLKPARKIVIYPGQECYPINKNTEVCSLQQFLTQIANVDSNTDE